jgi:hypothetical protein
MLPESLLGFDLNPFDRQENKCNLNEYYPAA